MRDWNQRRLEGQEPPYIPLGPFKLRLPGIHYRFEFPDYCQGILMCAVCLSIIPVLQEYLGMPFEVALAIVCLNGFLYLFHSHLGDPVVPGWITPAIPLIITYVTMFPMGPERMHALIAFQILFGIWCLILGITGLGSKVIRIIPSGIKAGVILGAGVAAIELVFKVGGRLQMMPITISVCALVALFMLYNMFFRKLANQNAIVKFIANFGILPAIIIAIIISPLVGEAKIDIQWGFSSPAFGVLWREWVPWGTIGWPSFDLYLKSIPLVISTYIVVFGEVLQARSIIKDGQPVRPDDPADYDENRTHLITGIRNSAMGVIAPDMSMCGPMWAAMTVVTTERWKKGRKAMDSLIGGTASFRWGTFTGYWLLPVVTITKPILPAALSLTMIIQGFVAVYVGIREAKCLKDLGIAGIVAGVLATRGAAWAFAAGLIACFIVYGTQMFKQRHPEEPPIWADQDKEEAEDARAMDATVQTAACCVPPSVRELMEAGKDQPAS